MPETTFFGAFRDLFGRAFSSLKSARVRLALFREDVASVATVL